MTKKTGGLILAAGKGTRMFSHTPKALQELLGLPLLWYVYESTRQVANNGTWTVIGHGREQVEKCFPGQRFIVQQEQLGTGHALQVAWPEITAANPDYILVCNGDCPLITSSTLKTFLAQTTAAGLDLAFLSFELEDPGSYGRVVRDQNGQVTGIVEAKDFLPDRYDKPCREINSGIYLLRPESISPLLSGLDNKNKQQEYYITQLIKLALAANLKVDAIRTEAEAELLGVNTARELVEAEEYLRNRIVQNWIDAGVRIRNHNQVRISPQVHIEPGVDICGPCEIYGSSRIEAGAIISSHCVLHDVHLGACQLKPFSHIDRAEIGVNAVIGPYTRIRPGSCLEENVRVGNFVEIKKSLLHSGVKAGHLSYLGDSEIGTDVNIGAGTITCNYDGSAKHQTHIKDGAFIGSNTALVAPVTIGNQAVIGAGSVVTHDVPEQHLCIARTRQKNLPLRKKKQNN